jgi:allophanate hydrolase
MAQVDIEPLLEAGRLLYDGAFVAERHAAFGAFAEAHPEAVDPSVLRIVRAAAVVTANALVADGERLDELRPTVAALFADIDALMLPTAPFQPTIAAVAADPLGVNAALGVFSSFVNLLDLSAIAVPAGDADGGRFGVTLLAPAFGDRVLADLAATLTGEPRPAGGPDGIELLVVGAHRTEQPLNAELTDRGARLLGVRHTTGAYRLYALTTDPPKPGLVRAHEGGAAIEGELWQLPSAALGPFLAGLPRPMALGHIELADGREVVGFTCETEALDGAPDITSYGSWPAYLKAMALISS